MENSMSDNIKKAVAKIPEEGSIKAAAIIARTFYREMRRYGFTSDQIIRVASEILGCLDKSLRGYEEKLEKDE